MESNASVPGSRQLKLKKSFNRGLRCLLTACSGEEFRKAFPSFTALEQERLHQLFVQVVSSVHQDIEGLPMLSPVIAKRKGRAVKDLIFSFAPTMNIFCQFSFIFPRHELLGSFPSIHIQ